MAACGAANHRSATAGASGPVSVSTPEGGGQATTTIPGPLTAGHEGTRGSVPWAEVGPGWFLAKWAPAPRATATASASNPPGSVLYLVDPTGGRYRLASGAGTPDGRFLAWSADGRRALFAGHPTRAAAQYVLMDLATGGQSLVTLPAGPPGDTPTVDFTEPHGLGLVESGWYQSSPPSATPVQRFDLTGRLQLSYPAGSGAGASPAGPVAFLYRPDGTQILVAAPGGVQVAANDGTPAALLPDPPGTTSCAPISWWSTAEVLLSCRTDHGSTLWLQPTSEDPPTELATEGADSAQAWQLTSGIYATDPRCIGSACTGIGRLGGDGTTVAPVGIPDRGPGQVVTVVGASADQLAVYGLASPPSSRGFLEWLNPDTGASTPLLGGLADAGSVSDVIAQPPAVPSGPSSPQRSSPHFDTPQAAMTYLASAWNRNDLTELGYVTNPPARAALQAMHSEAVNLRLDHCTPRPEGDYLCYFDHDYPAGTTTTVPGGGQAVFLVGPAATPGWYMTVFQHCG